MVSVTQATVENNIPLFLKSLLTNNLTDPLSATRVKPFVFKDPPETENDEYPYIIIESNPGNDKLISIDRSLRVSGERSYTIRIASKGDNAIQYRDQLADEVLVTLAQPTSEDSDAVSIEGNHILIDEMSSDTSDVFTQDGEVVRIKEITIMLKYGGS